MRIAVGGFHHETNTFAQSRATVADFEAPDAWPGLTRGADLPDAFQGMNIPISGFLAAAAEAGHAAAPLLWCSAGPSGPVEETAYEHIAALLLEALAEAGPVDGVYLCLHGAMVSEHLEDGEGELLRRVRAAVGDVPIVASLDLHANVTRAMIETADGLTAYRSYPHLDMAETGRRAVAILAERMGGGRFAHRFEKLPFLIPLTWQCTLIEPASDIYQILAGLEDAHDVHLSFTQGFPPADIADCGPAVFGYGGEAAVVEDAVRRLADAVEAREGDFAGRLWSPAEAVAHAIAQSDGAGGRPIVIADTQDNPGAGANADGTALIAELVEQGAADAVVGLLCDPAAARLAHDVGVGGSARFELGRSNGRFACEARVDALSDGAFAATGPFYAGSAIRLGPMAVLRVDGVRVVVSSRKQQAADQAMFTHLGIDPAEQKILVLKSSVHFRADFQNLAAEVLVATAPGPNIADPAKLPYERLRGGVRLRPMGPSFGGG